MIQIRRTYVYTMKRCNTGRDNILLLLIAACGPVNEVYQGQPPVRIVINTGAAIRSSTVPRPLSKCVARSRFAFSSRSQLARTPRRRPAETPRRFRRSKTGTRPLTAVTVRAACPSLCWPTPFTGHWPISPCPISTRAPRPTVKGTRECTWSI